MTDAAKAAQRAYKQQWRDKNRDHIREYNKAWTAANRDKLREKRAQYWEKKAAQMTKEENDGPNE